MRHDSGTLCFELYRNFYLSMKRKEDDRNETEKYRWSKSRINIRTMAIVAIHRRRRNTDVYGIQRTADARIIKMDLSKSAGADRDILLQDCQEEF